MRTNHVFRFSAAILLTTVVGAAHAHPGHGTGGLMAGLLHPFGLDHLLAMLAVGVWSVMALPAGRTWQGPTVFLLALTVSAVLGMLGLAMPYLEHGIALSVVLFGAMLMLALVRSALPPLLGLGLIALAAALHGLAHGAEGPATGFAGYVIGFLVTTAVLHTAGVGVGLTIRRWLADRSGLAFGGLGAAFGATGMLLFSRLAA